MFTDPLGVLLSPTFLITFGLVLAFFAPLAYSVWRTWEDNRIHRVTAVVVPEKQQAAPAALQESVTVETSASAPAAPLSMEPQAGLSEA